MTADPKVTPEHFAETEELMATVRSLERRLRLSQAKTHDLDGAAAERDELQRRLAVTGRIGARDITVPRWMATKAQRSTFHATPTLLLTDTHFDEVVLPEQIDWLNAYNRKIAKQRFHRCIETTIMLAREFLTGLTYDGFLLMVGGDIFSGIIHQELRETNEVPILKSVAYWEDELAAGLDRLATEFSKLHVACTYGNHARQSIKPIAKNRAWDTFEWLMYTHLAKHFAGSKAITFQIPDGPDCLVQSYGTRYLLTHGDQFRGGSGISGSMTPLMLGSYRKTRRAMSAGKPYDIMVLGHRHEYVWLPSYGIITGASLVGYNEYAYQHNFGFEEANQAFWVATPEHGVTFPMQVYVQDRKAEGW